jgi:hypothetical protein
MDLPQSGMKQLRTLADGIFYVNRKLLRSVLAVSSNPSVRLLVPPLM